MAKKNIYAVKRGKITGLFLTWEECRNAVEGYPGAEYKGFATKEEAKVYLGIQAENLENQLPGQVIAYVDGSYNEAVSRYSFGCVLLTPEGEIVRKSGSGDNPDSLALRNVTGEMLGAMFAVQWTIKHGYQAVDIRYDYSGIEMWATGQWKAKNALTQKYAAYMQANGHKVAITYKKIAAHTGDKYNEEADVLAKEALSGELGIPDASK